MANIKSAKKRVLVNQTKARQNKILKTNLKTVIKNANNAMETGAETSAEAVRVAIKKIDQAAAHGILHKNCAARKKSKLAAKLAKMN